jgi:hypothetical protein
MNHAFPTHESSFHHETFIERRATPQMGYPMSKKNRTSKLRFGRSNSIVQSARSLFHRFEVCRFRFFLLPSQTHSTHALFRHPSNVAASKTLIGSAPQAFFGRCFLTAMPCCLLNLKAFASKWERSPPQFALGGTGESSLRPVVPKGQRTVTNIAVRNFYFKELRIVCPISHYAQSDKMSN